MKRVTMLLIGLGVVLVLVLWYLLLWTPRTEELAAVEGEIATVETQQATTRSRIAVLEGVREQAPQLQAELAAAESLLPRETALPSALRQLQQAADESGATLVSVAPSRPELIEGEAEGLYAIGLNTEIQGSYFQIVDTIRRLEDPAISPRGIVWDSTAVTLSEHPNLIAVLTGRMFAVLPLPPAPEPDPADDAPEADAHEADVPEADAPEAEADAPETDADPDMDVDADVEVDQ